MASSTRAGVTPICAAWLMRVLSGLAWLLARAVDAVPVRLNVARIKALTTHAAKTGSTTTGQPVP